MKRFLYNFILVFLLSFSEIMFAQGLGQYTVDGFKLNPGIDPNSLSDIKKVNELWKTHGKGVSLKDFDESMTYLYSRKVDRAPCNHCPEYLKLSSAVNKAIKEMPVTEVTQSNLVQIRSNELEFMYVVNRYEFEDGKVGCKKYFDSDPLRDQLERKKEGSYRVLTSTIADLTALGNIQFIDTNLDEAFYYYRGKDDKKNFIYEVRSKKNQPYTITVYEYLPSDKEKNPYNLPDLDGGRAPIKVSDLEDVSSTTKEGEVDNDPNNYLDMQFKLEKRGKYLPKDYHFMQAGTETSLMDLVKLKSTTKLSVKERSTKWSLSPVESQDSQDEYVRFELRHKGLDEVGTKVVVPYKIELSKESGTSIIGSVSEEVVREKGQINSQESNKTLSLVLTDHDLEMIRLEARKSRADESLVSIGHTRALGKDETLHLSTGYRESNATGSAHFFGVQHAKKIKESTTMVLDLKYDSKAKGTIMWQIQHKF